MSLKVKLPEMTDWHTVNSQGQRPPLRNCIFVHSGRMSHTPRTARSMSPLNLVVFVKMVVSSNRIYKMHEITLIHVISTHCRIQMASYYTIIAFQILSPICTFEDILKTKYLFRLPMSMSRFQTFSSRFKSVGTQKSCQPTN